MTDRACPKCSGPMQEGFTLDQSDVVSLQSAWVEGQPLRSFWTGLKISESAKHPVMTYRCAACGYLESYAKST